MRASPREHRGEGLLLAGLVLVSAAFVPFIPILWLIAQFILGPAALVCLIAGVWRARNATVAIRRQVLALVVLLSALVGLYGASFSTMAFANEIFPPRGVAAAMTADHWLRLPAIWIVPAILSALGLRCWTDWSRIRCIAWGAAVFVVPLAELLGFWLILQTDPVRTA